MMSDCLYSGKCGGCPHISVPYTEQIEKKRIEIDRLTNEILKKSKNFSTDFRETQAIRTRHRTDLTYISENNSFKFGMFSIDKSELVDLEACPQMTLELENWFLDFRKYLIPNLSNKASFRLRINSEGRRGVWMDLPNLAVKSLLEEEKWLLGLLEQNVVIEIGQKRKRVLKKDEKLKLVSYEDGAALEPWTATKSGLTGSEIKLYGPVGGFSQPGSDVNNVLVNEVSLLVGDCGGKHWLELGSGNGNFSFAIQNHNREIMATDFDPLSLLSANLSRNEFSKKHPELKAQHSRLQFEHLNFQSKKTSIPEGKFDSVLVDPPRSGLGLFVEVILDLDPKNIVYVSCYPETWKTDVVQFLSSGYELARVVGVDLFPGTEHFEIVSLLQKK